MTTYKVPMEKSDEFRKYLKEHDLYKEEIHRLTDGGFIEFIILLGASAKAIVELDKFYNKYVKGKE